MKRNFGFTSILFIVLASIVSAGPRTEARTAERIGLYTGTFDPPHEGHRKVIETAVRELGLDEIVVIPNYQPSLKPNATSFVDRLAMSEKAFGKGSRVRVATAAEAKHAREIGLASLLGEISHAKPTANIFHIMGDDSFDRLSERAGVSFPTRVTIAVTIRDHAPEMIPARLAGRPVVTLKPGENGLSSSLIRKLLVDGAVVSVNQLSVPVQEYVYQHHLYGASLACSRVFNPYDL